MWCEQEVTALQKLLSFIYLFRFTSHYAFRLKQSRVALKNSLGTPETSDIFILTQPSAKALGGRVVGRTGGLTSAGVNSFRFAVLSIVKDLLDCAYSCSPTSVAVFEVRHPRCVEPKLQNGKKYVQNTAIFISYELVDHIAVYNYMFRPLSPIVRLYYFLL